MRARKRLSPFRSNSRLPFLIDDRRGVIAARKGLTDIGIGTLGILGLAAQRGLLNLAEAFERLKRTNFRYREEVLNAALAQASAEIVSGKC